MKRSIVVGGAALLLMSAACSSQSSESAGFVDPGPAVVVAEKSGVVTRTQAGYVESITFREDGAPVAVLLTRGADNVAFNIDPVGNATITSSSVASSNAQAFVANAVSAMGFVIVGGGAVAPRATGDTDNEKEAGADPTQCSANDDGSGDTNSAGSNTQNESPFHDGNLCQTERDSWDDADDNVTMAALGTAGGTAAASPAGGFLGACAWGVARGARTRAARRLVDCCNRVDPNFTSPNCSMIWWHYWPLPFPS